MSNPSKKSIAIKLDDLDRDELKKLIIDAQKEIERKEKLKIRELRTKMEELAKDAGMSAQEVINYDKKTKTTKTPGVPRYKNPENPKQTWTGRGKRPKWFLDAIAKGFTPEQMEIA